MDMQQTYLGGWKEIYIYRVTDTYLFNRQTVNKGHTHDEQILYKQHTGNEKKLPDRCKVDIQEFTSTSLIELIGDKDCEQWLDCLSVTSDGWYDQTIRVILFHGHNIYHDIG